MTRCVACFRLRTLINGHYCLLPGVIEPCTAWAETIGAIMGFVIASARKSRWELCSDMSRCQRCTAKRRGGGGVMEWAVAGLQQPIGFIGALCHLLSLPTANRRVADKRFERCLKLRARRPRPLTPAGFVAVTARAVPSGIRPPPSSWILQRTPRRHRRGSVPFGFDIAQPRLHLLLGPYSQERPVYASFVFNNELLRYPNATRCEYGPWFLWYGY